MSLYSLKQQKRNDRQPKEHASFVCFREKLRLKSRQKEILSSCFTPSLPRVENKLDLLPPFALVIKREPSPYLQTFLMRQIIQTFSMAFCYVGDFEKGMLGRFGVANASEFLV